MEEIWIQKVLLTLIAIVTSALIGVVLCLPYIVAQDANKRAKESEICQSHGMEITDIYIQSGKTRYTHHACRAPNGQLYQF